MPQKPIIDVIVESSEEDVEIIRLGVEETRSETVSGQSGSMRPCLN